MELSPHHGHAAILSTGINRMTRPVYLFVFLVSFFFILYLFASLPFVIYVFFFSLLVSSLLQPQNITFSITYLAGLK